MSWEYNDVLALIEMYREAPELWDIEHSDYHNLRIGEKIYRSMASRFNKSSYDVKAKIKSLRCMYLRQHKKEIQKQNKNGSYSGHNVCWFGYKPMSFLEKLYDKKGFSKSEEIEDQDTIDSCEESNMDQDFAEESDDEDNNSADMMWTRDDVAKLIGMYKEYPILWDSEHPNYHHKQMRLKAMKLIAETFKTSIPEIKNKIKNIRTMFLNMHKKIKSTIEQEGKWTGKIWHGYKLMGFLVKEGLPNIDQVACTSDPSWRRGLDNDENTDDLQENSSRTHWDQRDFLKLIKLYESHSLLWDTKNEDYSNRFARLESIQSLARVMNKPRQEVESKLRNLRTQFFKNHKRIQEMVKTNGRITGTVWFGYKPMMFLANVTCERRHGNSDNEKVIIKKEHFSCDDDDDSHVSTNSNEMLEISLPIKRKKKRKYSESDDDSNDPLEFLSNKRKSADPTAENKPKTDDEIAVFGQFITQELRKIKDEYALMLAKKQISEIVFRAQIHQASASSNKTDLLEENSQ